MTTSNPQPAREDPRVDVLSRILATGQLDLGNHLAYQDEAVEALEMFDSADRIVGIVRVDTNDEATVLLLAKAIGNVPFASAQGVARARRALAALRGEQQ
jgi:hypothetical protein